MELSNTRGRRPKIADEYMRAIENERKLRDIMYKADVFDQFDDIGVSMDYVMKNIMPELPELDFLKEVTENGVSFNTYRTRYGSEDSMFRTRADYERTLRYLQRYNRAAESRWVGADTFSIYGVETQMTSVRIVDGEVQSEFMRREASLAARNANRRAIEALREQGINVVQQPVYKLNEETGELTPMYNRSRHPVVQYVPESPEQERKYFYAIQQDSSLQLIQPAIPENGVLMKWNDAVPVEQKSEPVLKSGSILRTLRQDEQDYDKAELFLRNFKDNIDTVLPSGLSEKFDEVFDAILDADPESMLKGAKYLSGDGGAEINALELWYRDSAHSAGVKLGMIIESLKKAAEQAEIDREFELNKVSDAQSLDDELGDSVLRDGQNVYTEYQQAKKEGRAFSTTLGELKEMR